MKELWNALKPHEHKLEFCGIFDVLDVEEKTFFVTKPPYSKYAMCRDEDGQLLDLTKDSTARIVANVGGTVLSKIKGEDLSKIKMRVQISERDGIKLINSAVVMKDGYIGLAVNDLLLSDVAVREGFDHSTPQVMPRCLVNALTEDDFEAFSNIVINLLNRPSYITKDGDGARYVIRYIRPNSAKEAEWKQPLLCEESPSHPTTTSDSPKPSPILLS